MFFGRILSLFRFGTLVAVAAVLSGGTTTREARGQDDFREGGSSPAGKYPRSEAERTPENVRGYDSSPHLLDIVWEYKSGWRIEGEPVRVGSQTLTVRHHGRLHRLVFDRLTEPCKVRARRFQVTGRIEPLPLPPEQQQELDGWHVRSYRYVRAPGQTITFLLYAPDGKPPARGERPLLLFLSGSGGVGTDNFRQWTDANGVVKNLLSPDFQRHLPCYVLIPQSENSDNAWVGPTPQYPGHALELAVQSIDILKSSLAPRIDMKRLYVTGLSAGAYGCFQALEAFPGKFAAAVPVQGTDLYEGLNRDNARPMWMVFNGNYEWGASPADADELAHRYKALHVEMRQTRLPGDNFDAWKQAYPEAAFRDWLGDQALARVTYPSDWKHPVKPVSPVSEGR